MLTSADLFCGIAGMTAALHDLGVRPVLYCDKDPDAQRVVASLIKKGSIPKAPIYPDVRTVSVPPSTDLVLAGFPCQGFSNAGERAGLRHRGSSLVSHVYRIVRTVKPKAVFLENVSALLDKAYAKDLRQIFKTFHAMGYDGRWVKMHGFDVACPQKRVRVYMLFHRRGTKLPTLSSSGHRRFSWKREPVPRAVAAGGPPDGRTIRVKLLGNSVIPEMTRLAFLILWSGFTRSAKSLVTSSRVPFVAGVRETTNVGDAGVVRDGVTTGATKPETFAQTYTPPVIVLDPTVYRSDVRSKNTAEIIRRPISAQGWGTIRTRSNGANHVLTERSRYDPGTQIRFARDTPNHLRRGVYNIGFYEWLMGYPQGWTSV